MLGGQEASMKSIRPYKSSEEYLYAMKEDLAEWLKDLYGLDVDVESFLDILETGVLLCHHAKNITQLARDLTQEYPVVSKKIHLPSRGVSCNDFAQPGTFQARDNVSNFIHWCRKEMAITDVLMFETEDLVLRKNEKNFVLCLLEVARRASRFGMSAPTLVQMEEEIEDEIREELKLPREELPLPKPPRRPPDFKNLDQMVQHLVSRCTCPVQFSMIKVTDGKYRVGDSNTLIFVRILRKHVMVRVGGGWDTLEHYLDKHDPCRCTSLSHKQALKTAGPQKTQAAQVQHEITTRFTPGMDPRKAQPVFIVSRSQSPLPPVEWRTYVPHSLSPRRRVPSSSEMSPDSNESGRKKEGHLTLQDSSESRMAPSVRGREQPATPLGRLLATQEERPRSRQSLLSRSETPCESSSPLQKVATERDVLNMKSLPQPCHGSIQVTVNSQEAEGENSTSSNTIRASLTSGRPRPELKLRPPTPTRSSSPCKHFQTSSKQAPEVQTGGQVSGVPQGDRWRKATNTGRSLTPVKQLCHVQKEESGTKGPGNVGLMSYRPPTPSQSYGGSLGLRKAGKAMAKGQEPKVEFGSQKDVRKTRDGSPERAGVGINRLDLKLIRKDSRGLLGQKGGPDSSWKDGPKSHGDTKELLVEKERVYTPLPINVAEEQALYRSLEDEIMANIKELESSDEVHHLLKGSQLRRFEREPGRDTRELACNVSRLLSTPTSPSWPDTKKALDFREGVPRSGVYVPEGETRWPPAGPGYEAVIQELSMALRQEHVGMLPTRNSSLRSGNRTPKEVLTKKAAQEEKTTPNRMGDDGPLPTTDKGQAEEVNLNGDTTQATSSPATNSSESFATLENMELPLSKPRRSLKKPERVPSIYKLKLRPKIRPRRDHRPEKKPSRIPTPVSYRHVRRTSSGRSQTRTPRNCPTKRRETTETQNSKVEDLSTTHDGGRTMTKEEAGASDDEDSWV